MATTLAKDKKGQVTGNYSQAAISGAVPGVNQYNTQLQQMQNQLKQAGTGSGSASTPGISGVYVNGGTAPALQNPAGGTQKTATPYTGLAGVSDNTAKQTGRYQQDYEQSDAVTKAQQALDAIQAQKPKGYTSKYQDQLDGILQKITNPDKFKYEFNGDELFRSYADYYTQMGKQASADAMGQAAALTGGYGNTYAQNAGQQAYQQYLLGLYDKGMDMYDRAYQRWQDEQQANLNQYNVLAGADQTDYGRYRDTVGDWQNDRDYYTGRYDTEADRDYSRWTGNRDYWTGLAQVENADYRSEQERQEAIRQYNENMAYQKATDDKQYAYNYAMAILQNGQMPSKTILKLAGLTEEDAKKLIKKASSGGGGGGKKKTPDKIDPVDVVPDNPETFMYGVATYEPPIGGLARGVAEAVKKAAEEANKKGSVNNPYDITLEEKKGGTTKNTGKGRNVSVK